MTTANIATAQWFTTINLSYRLPIFETSATALCGTTGALYIRDFVNKWVILCFIIIYNIIYVYNVYTYIIYIIQYIEWLSEQSIEESATVYRLFSQSLCPSQRCLKTIKSEGFVRWEVGSLSPSWDTGENLLWDTCSWRQLPYMEIGKWKTRGMFQSMPWIVEIYLDSLTLTVLRSIRSVCTPTVRVFGERSELNFPILLRWL